MKFEELNLIEPILKAVREKGYETPTPIQVEAIPELLKGRDLKGCAQTGTGKTAAFALPIIQRLMSRKPGGGKRHVRALVLSPTRELATQIFVNFQAYARHTPLRGVVIYGGVSQHPQAKALNQGVDYVIATPGRLQDLLNQKLFRLDDVQVLVLDEADRMLDMGFIVDIRKIIRMLPKKRQTLLFSATMPKELMGLANSILTDPLSVEVTPGKPTVDLIDQKLYLVEHIDKIELLKHFLEDPDFFRVLVFCNTKNAVDTIASHLNRPSIKEKIHGRGNRKHRRAEAIHSGKNQRVRERVLERFKEGKIQVLVATDIAARGIDVEDVDHVVNYDFPNEPEIYIHRIGRTGRAGSRGVALSFCARHERTMLNQIELLIKQHLDLVEDHPFKSEIAAYKRTVLDPKERARNLARGMRRGRRRR